MGGARSQRKGKNFERKVAILLRDVWNTWRGAGQCRRGDDAADVEGSPFWIECKHEKRWPSIPRAWQQATDATDGRPILVVTKKDKEPILVTMTMEQFQHLAGGFADDEEKELDNA